jgi:hypothetical protein
MVFCCCIPMLEHSFEFCWYLMYVFIKTCGFLFLFVKCFERFQLFNLPLNICLWYHLCNLSKKLSNSGHPTNAIPLLGPAAVRDLTTKLLFPYGLPKLLPYVWLLFKLQARRFLLDPVIHEEFTRLKVSYSSSDFCSNFKSILIFWHEVG